MSVFVGKLIPPSVATLPASGTLGQIIALTTDGQTYIWNGSASTWDQVMALDSAEQEYTPGPLTGQLSASGDTTLYTNATAGGFVLRRAALIPVLRGTEDAPVITLKRLSSANALLETIRVVAAMSERLKVVCNNGDKIAVNLDIAARVPWTLVIQEL